MARDRRPLVFSAVEALGRLGVQPDRGWTAEMVQEAAENLISLGVVQECADGCLFHLDQLDTPRLPFAPWRVVVPLTRASSSSSIYSTG